MSGLPAWPLALGLAVLGTVVAGAAVSREVRPAVAAHRGGALLWPENSLLAFRRALELGVDALETDAHLTADGEVVLLHDPTLERTTTGTGRVAARRLAELAELRLRDGAGRPTGEPVPTLAGLLAVLAPARAELLLEIKADADGHRYPGIEERVLALLAAQGMRDRTLIMSFQPETLARVRELEPAIRTVLLFGARHRGLGAAEMVRRATDVRATALGLQHSLLETGVLEAARAAGLRVGAWTVNEEPDLRRVIGLGVDMVVTDRPDLALRVRGR